MKTWALLAILTTLCACSTGGGSGGMGPAGTPGKSAYEIWLEQGNTGTEQDFLDSLVADDNNNTNDNTGGNNNTTNPPTTTVTPSPYNNAREELKAFLTDCTGYTETTVPWPGHDNYNRYELVWLSGGVKFTYNEKELHFGNYNTVKRLNTNPVYANLSDVSAHVYMRKDSDATVFVPIEGQVFHGGTLAYLWRNNGRSGYQDTPLLTGSATFTYYPTSPILNVAFDNYYNITFAKQTSSGYVVDISGNNNTGDEYFNLPTGTMFIPAYNPNGQWSAALENEMHLQKDSIQETFGTYHLQNKGTNTFILTGAYGATN